MRLTRALRTDTKTWIEGFYFETNDGQGYIFTDTTVENSVVDLPARLMTEVYPVDKETAGVDTGALDRKGNRIFEGDILLITETDEPFFAKVRYDKQAATYQGYSCDDPTGEYYSVFLDDTDHIEVIPKEKYKELAALATDFSVVRNVIDRFLQVGGEYFSVDTLRSIQKQLEELSTIEVFLNK